MWAEMISACHALLVSPSRWVVQLQSMCCEPCELTVSGAGPQLRQKLRSMGNQKLGGLSPRNMGSSVLPERTFLALKAKDLGAAGSEVSVCTL